MLCWYMATGTTACGEPKLTKRMQGNQIVFKHGLYFGTLLVLPVCGFQHAACGHFSVMPRTDTSKLLVDQAVSQLRATSATLAALRNEMQSLGFETVQVLLHSGVVDAQELVGGGHHVDAVGLALSAFLDF